MAQLSDFEIEVHHTVNGEEWDKKLSDNRMSTAFQISRLNEFYQSYGSKPIFVLVKDSNKKIVGQLSAVIFDKIYWSDSNIISKSIGHMFNLRRILTWSYGPIIHDQKHSEEIVTKIFETLDKISINNKVVMIKGSFHPFFLRISDRLFKQFNYKITMGATYIIDLQDNDDVYNKLDKKTRYDIRKSEESELEFVVTNDRKSLDDFTKLKIQEKIRYDEKTKSESMEHNDSRWKYLCKDGYEKIFLAYFKGEPVAGILNTIFNGYVIQKRVSIGSKTQSIAGTFLTWNTIKWCMEQKYAIYDMGGINPNPINDRERSIAFYKSKWGGKKVRYVELTKLIDPMKWKISSILKNPKKLSKVFL